MKGLRIPTSLPPWREVMVNAELAAWYPLCFDRREPGHAAAMDELLGSGEIVFIHDMLDAQLRDLIKCRQPARPYTEDELKALVAETLEGTGAQDYGRWVFFPWSRRLVHLLPPDEFTEVRADRNRNKITRAEQALLRRLKIALAGLSVGNAVANSLALEGVFGELRLADFDTLDLSNMNRIRCGVHDIGVNKAVITARQIFEQNPYANLVLYTDGVTAENLGEFIDGDGASGRVDVVIDECDSLYIKIKLREEARARRVPVIMETSDRGMLDIERFDLEPDRPILHGLLGGLSAADILTIPPPARLGLILQIIGEATISPRLAASLLEFGHTLRGLSQLGSDVTLGGATTTTAVRYLGLGAPLPSGRVFVDVSGILADIRSPARSTADVARTRFERDVVIVRKLVEQAILAPSDGNNQPWRFIYRGDRVLQVRFDPSRGAGGVDAAFERQNGYIAIGAGIENITLTAGVQNLAAKVELFPQADDEDLVATIRLDDVPGAPVADPLHEQISQRRTNRRPGTRNNLMPIHGQVLTSAARDGGAKLQLCTERESMDELGRLLGEADRLRLLSPALHVHFVRQMRWTPEEALRTRDGLAPEMLASGPGELVTFNLMRSGAVPKLLRDIHGGAGLAMSAVQAVSSSAAIAFLSLPGTAPEAFVRGGRAMQQLWLTATALGLAVQPWNCLLQLFARVDRFQGAGLDKREVQQVLELRDRFAKIFKGSLGDAEILLFRLFYADPPAQRSLRRPADAVLTIERPD
ncbi:MAG: Rv1355c family protein [Nannocystis sp.]|nr:Rv1355c family protein [Nannocystis sp.]MBA3545812.1 Rv1355c family protein [Nannocystis sp.]